jgi:hypothetical protein
MSKMNTIANNTIGGRAILLLMMLAVLLFGGFGSAQAQTEEDGMSKFAALDTIPEAARALFESHVPKEDTLKAQQLKKYRSDKLIKRFSIHTNIVDWATLVPNLGIEFDINPTVRNNYSVSVFGKYNGNSSHGKLVYNVNGIRVEGRKYWRTGKFGTPKGSANNYYSQFEDIDTDTASIYFNADTLAGYSYYADEIGHKAKDLGTTNKDVGYSLRAPSDWTDEQKDSLDFAEDSLVSDKSRFRTWLYNTYHKVRRNYTSGRTLDNPRNWRAYYFGVWAGLDNWCLSLTGKGTQGNGIGLGVSGGYSIPLFPQKFPREGSLDLDLGITVGNRIIFLGRIRHGYRARNIIIAIRCAGKGNQDLCRRRKCINRNLCRYFGDCGCRFSRHVIGYDGHRFGFGDSRLRIRRIRCRGYIGCHGLREIDRLRINGNRRSTASGQE